LDTCDCPAVSRNSSKSREALKKQQTENTRQKFTRKKTLV